MSNATAEEICNYCGGRIEAERVDNFGSCSACAINIERPPAAPTDIDEAEDE